MVGIGVLRPESPLWREAKRVTLLQQFIATGGVVAFISGMFAWLIKRQDLKAIEQQHRLDTAALEAKHKIDEAAALARQKLEYELKLLGHAPELLNQDMQRFIRLEATVSKLEGQVAHLQARLEEEEAANVLLKADLATMTRQYNDVAARCENLMTENSNLRTQSEESARKQKFDNNTLAQKVSDLEEIVMGRADNPLSVAEQKGKP